ncbi:MAG: hypothetical protein WCW02_04305 [Candidatus Buchananbacteria bacterium]
MNCQKTENLIKKWLAGKTLTTEEKKQINLHLKSCQAGIHADSRQAITDATFA